METAASSAAAAVAPAVDGAIAAVHRLCRSTCMELEAWQQRMPVAEHLLNACVQQRHIMMLLMAMATAEGQADMAQLGLPCAKGTSAQTAHSDSGFECTQGALETLESAAAVEHVMLHYDLMRRDGFKHVFLRNSAVHISNEEGRQTGSSPPCQVRGFSSIAATDAGSYSFADLLVWISRCPATWAFFQRVEGIAHKEHQAAVQVRASSFSQQLSELSHTHTQYSTHIPHGASHVVLVCDPMLPGLSRRQSCTGHTVRAIPSQVCQAEAVMKGMSLSVSSVRTATVYAVDFVTAEQQLLGVKQQLADIWQLPSHIGVLSKLSAVQELQNKLLEGVQVRCASRYCVSIRQRVLCAGYHRGWVHPRLIS